MTKRNSLILLFSLVAFMMPQASDAYDPETDIMLRHSSMCTQSFTKAEGKYGIPKHLLMAVANTESGRYHKGLKRMVPWPWTTNIAGKGGYHDSIHDAMTAVRRAQQGGTKSIDVGCMQINLKHHPKAFNNLMEAFNPKHNVEYAAKFLRSNYDEMRSWPRAIAAYHSRSPGRGQKYYAAVRKRWRDVRANAGGQLIEDTDYIVQGGVKLASVNQKSSSKKPAHSTFKMAMRDDISGITRSASPRKRATKAVSGERAASMKVIKVASRRVDSNAIVVMTPTAQSKSGEFFVSSSNKKSNNVARAKVVSAIDRSLSSDTTRSVKRKQPNFIFNQ